MTVPPSKTCRWCGRAFTERRGGSPQVFCRCGCRTAFHTAGRRWAERAVAAGVLTVAELQAIPADHLLVTGVKPASEFLDDMLRSKRSAQFSRS